MTPPHRRWFRLAFSLRTLFVVVTLASCAIGWVAHQLNWISRRHEARRAQLARSKMGFSDNAPWQLRWLGEHGLPHAVAREPEASRLRALFPEAEIEVDEDRPPPPRTH